MVNIENVIGKRVLSDGVHVDFEDDVLYPYAVVAENRLMHISEVTRENRKQYEYKCPCCKKGLSPRLGNKKKHHYSHVSGARCDVDRYIHDTAKALLKQRFDSEDKFIVEFKVEKKCKSIDVCFWATHCQRKSAVYECKNIDMKEYYTECIEEKKVGDFIPDLVLENKDKGYEPVFIEIWSKHKSSEKKMQSGYRIIEIRLKSVSDLDKLRSGSIVESDAVTFSNFKKLELEDYYMEFGLHRYSFYESGKLWFEKCSCDSMELKSQKTLVLDVLRRDEHGFNLLEWEFVDFCRFLGIDYGIDALKNCYICNNCDGDKSKTICLKKDTDVDKIKDISVSYSNKIGIKRAV